MSNSDSDDDYMSSKFLSETTSTTEEKETYSERRRQKKLLNTGYHKPRHELEKERREEGLSKPIDLEENNSPGLRLLKKMGYEKGMVLGKNSSALASTEPLTVELKQDRLGLGMSTEVKKRTMQQLADTTKRVKLEEDAFRNRVREDRLAKRIEGQFHTLQKICQTLDSRKASIFWPDPEIKEQVEKIIEIDNSSEESEEKIDEDKEEFEQLEDIEKRDQIIAYLRHQHYYCFWCGSEYANSEELDQECPGTTEEDHD
ncbi:hypothetical protein G9A89_016223 [Geosiphon pyriformis]|nr:hypothetical protein G9A89_016223 [Geosiphon pyriformis]